MKLKIQRETHLSRLRYNTSKKKKNTEQFSVDKFKGNIKKYLNNPKDDRKEVSQVKNQRALEEHE